MSMDYLERLNDVWELDEGFIGKLRHRIFDEKEYQKTVELFKSWPPYEGEYIPREVVTGLWFIPTFMERQKKVVCEDYPEDKYFHCQEEMIDLIANIIGCP